MFLPLTHPHFKLFLLLATTQIFIIFQFCSSTKLWVKKLQKLFQLVLNFMNKKNTAEFSFPRNFQIVFHKQIRIAIKA